MRMRDCSRVNEGLNSEGVKVSRRLDDVLCSATFEFDQRPEGQIEPVGLSLMRKVKTHLKQFLSRLGR